MKLRIFPRKKRPWKKRIGILVIFVLLIFFPANHYDKSQMSNNLLSISKSRNVSFGVHLRNATSCEHALHLIYLNGLPKPVVRVEPVNFPRRHVKLHREQKRYFLSHHTIPFHVEGMEEEILREMDRLEDAKLLLPGDELSVRIIDLKTNSLIVNVEANKSRMAASLIKPFVMLAVYDDVYNKKLKRSYYLERLLRRMIIVSNNWATNRLIRILGNGSSREGLRKVNQVIKKYGFSNTRMVEKIPLGGKTYRNYTNACDLSRFFYLLYHKDLISPYYCKLMLRKFLAVRTSRVRTRFLRRDKVPVADKTGFVCGLNGDAGIVFLSESFPRCHDYVFVFLAENEMKPRTIRWARQKTRVIRRLSNQVYLAFKTQVALVHHPQIVSSAN